MLKATDKDKLKNLGLDIDAIIAAYTDAAEKDIVVPEGQLLTDAQLTTRDANTKAEGVKEGEGKAFTIAKAELKKEGLEIKAKDRWADVAKEIKDSIVANGDDKSKLLSKQVDDLLLDKTTLTTERDNAIAKANSTIFQYDQFKHLPENRAKATNESEYLALMGMRGIEIKADGVYRNNEPIKDATTKAPLSHAEAYKQLFTEFKWIAEPPAGAAGGRGGGNSSGGAAGGGKARSMSEAETSWMADNPQGNIISPEFDAYVSAQAKDNPTFDYSK